MCVCVCVCVCCVCVCVCVRACVCVPIHAIMKQSPIEKEMLPTQLELHLTKFPCYNIPCFLVLPTLAQADMITI